MIPSPWAILAALAGIVVLVLSTWFYRGHLAGIEVKAAVSELTKRQDDANRTAQERSAQQTRSLQAAADVRAAQLQGQLQTQRKASNAQIASFHSQLVAAAGRCLVPRAALGVLDAGAAAVPGGSTGPAAAGPGAGYPPGGSLAASAVIETCERARGAFDRNAERLGACIAAYDAARAKVNARP